MQTLQINPLKARQLYPTATAEFKAMLEDTFGKEFFSQSIIDRVKDFNDILTISGITLDKLISSNDTRDEAAYKKAKLIAKVYNEGEELDPYNTNQYKYYPWHKILPGVGLSYFDYDFWFSRSTVGVRLCFKSAALAVDAGKKFLDIYTDLKIK